MVLSIIHGKLHTRQGYWHIGKISQKIALLWDFLRVGGTVFMCNYPLPELKDGYFQRIRSIDEVFSKKWRIYYNIEYYNPNYPFLEVRADRAVYVNAHPKTLSVMLLLFCVLRCGQVYFHSVIRLSSLWQRLVMKMPCIKKIWDVHGAVPEETEFQGDSAQAKLFGEYETLAAANADVILAVSNAMGRHLCKKYGDHLQQKIVILPIISKYEQLPIAADRQEGALPRIIYVGGVDKWQQIPLMLQIINAAYTLASWHIYTQEPETFMALLPDELRVKDLPIKSVTRDDLLQIYPKFSFGFVLRDRNILNVVSCPTKLVEYIALGIIPIMDEVSIGDFVELGLCYITKDDVLKRDLPSLEKTLEMREINYEVYKAIYNSYLQGLRRLCIAASL